MCTAAETSGAARISPSVPKRHPAAIVTIRTTSGCRLQRRAHRERLDQVLEQAVREDDEHEHDQRRRRAARAERDHHREGAADERADVRDVGEDEVDDADRPGQRDAEDPGADSPITMPLNAATIVTPLK